MPTDFTSNAATKSAIEAILKEKWVTEEIQRQYARDRVLLAILEKNSKQVDGLESVFTMRLSPNNSTGARGEMGDLPDAGRQSTKKVRIPLSYWYTVCAFSGQAIKASNNSATALAKIIADEMQNAVEDHKRVENSYLYGDGSGALAKVTAVDTTNKKITVNLWNGLFAVGRELETSTARDGSVSGGMAANPIVAVDRTNLTVTFANAITNAAVDDYVFLKGTKGNANMGLLGICDDGGIVSTFQTLSRASYPQIKAKVFSNATARNISESLLMDVIARMREDGSTPDIIIGTSFQLKDLCAEMHQQRRFIDDSGKMDLGVRGIKIGDGIDFTFDVDCPPGYSFAINKKNIIISEAAPLSFMDLDGNVMSRITGKDAYEATMFHYFNLIALSCYDQARIEKLNENRVGD